MTTAARRILMTQAEVAEQFHVSERTVRRYIATGRLRAYRLGPRRVLVDREDVVRLAQPIRTVER